MPVIRVENVTKKYTEEGRSLYAVRDLSLTVEQGDFVFLIGSSGAGKSTLLKLMGGEMSPDQGDVYLNEVNVSKAFGPWRTRVARSFGIVNQECQLIRKRTIADNLLLTAAATGMRKRGKEAARKALSIVGLAPVAECYPAELSLGECRRVELARALVNSQIGRASCRERV